jgi:hypothetical protein
LDKLTVALSSSSAGDYNLMMAINGKPTALEFMRGRGARMVGTASMRSSTRVRTAFRWRGWTMLRKRRRWFRFTSR